VNTRKVKVAVQFEVEGLEVGMDVDELTEDQARSAVLRAAYDHFEFSSGGVTSDAVTVHVDGYGECRVNLGTDHR